MARPRREATQRHEQSTGEVSNGRPEAVRIWLLGGFRVSVGYRTIEKGAWRLRKAASLIKLLALAPGHRMHRERAMGLLWPDLGSRPAANNLRQALHAARWTLEPGPGDGSCFLKLEGGQISLCPDGHLWVDVDAFEDAASAARHNRDIVAYRVATELYPGDLLPEDLYEDWAESRRVGLRRLYLFLVFEMAGLYEERGELEPAIETLEKLVTADPTHEEAYAGLMRLYAVSHRRGEALRHYERLREVLSTGFGKEPGVEIRHLHEEIMAGHVPPERSLRDRHHPTESADADRHNLPATLTSFVGREHEVVEVKRALTMTRLLTLTGTGGCGKTRLALEVAGSLTGTYPDGVWLAELAPLSEPELVTQEVAGSLGVREQPGRPLNETLVDFLRQKKLLLVLDNCEHLIDAAARLVHALLISCPHLGILTTSREPLGVEGEAVWRVASLPVPDTDRLPAARELTRYDAVRLFLDRARLSLPGFALGLENGRAVAEICRKLEGIPLAIELATARMGALAVEEVAQRLEDSLGLLTAGPRTVALRQRTMRSTLEWSYGLLSGAERTLFGRLSAFAGGFTLAAAETAEADSTAKSEVLDLLGRLVGKSLVIVEAAGDGATRYRMLEPIKQYARERLDESGEAEMIRSRHAAFFLALAEEAEPRLKEAHQEVWLGRLEREHDNLRAALLWALEQGQVDLALRLGSALGEFWHMRGHLSEGRRWLEAALAEGGEPSVARVRALAKVSWIAWEQTDLERATELGEEGLELARALGDEEGAAATLLNLAVAVMIQGELERATVLLEESLPLYRESGDGWGLARSLLCLGLVAMFRGKYERARALMEEGLTVSRESGDIWCSSMALNQLALMALLRRDYGRAQALCKETLELSRQSGMAHHIAFALHTSAALAGSRGRPVRSARLWGAAEALREAIGTAFSPMELRVYEPYIAAARAQVEDAMWEAAWQEGRAMSAEEAIEYALSEVEPTQATAHERTSPDTQEATLTRREEEVAALVARGLTNRQIATELSISEYTVANHVAKILRKLRLNSRSQLTAWITRRRLLYPKPG